MVLDSNKVSAIEAYIHLRDVRDNQTHVAALALGEVEQLVRERRSAGVVARDEDRGVGPNYLYNELGKVAGLFGELPSVLSYLDSFRCGVPLCAQQQPTQNSHDSEFARVTLRRFGQRVEASRAPV